MRKNYGAFWVIFALLCADNILGQNCWEQCATFEPVQTIEVTTGGFINSMSGFNVEAGEVRFDIFLWLKWPICQRLFSNETYEPHKSMELVNGIQKVDTSIKPTFPVPNCDVFPGSAYWEMRIEGRFQQALSFLKFPLDSHNLGIEIEDAVFTIEQLKYIADTNAEGGLPASGRKDSVYLSGWTLKDETATVQTRIYASSIFQEIDTSVAYSNFRLAVEVSRGATVFVMKIMPPVIITLWISIIVILLDVEATGSRVATAVGGLMSEIFLQLSFANYVPPTQYLTLLDWIFNICFVCIFLIIIECIIVRKIFYQLLLEDEAVKGEVQLDSLRTSTSLSGATSSTDLVFELQKNREKKERVRRRIRRVEKILFGVLLGVALGSMIIATVASALRGNLDT